MPQVEVSTKYLLQVLEDLINTPSPTGDTDWAVGFVEQELDGMGYKYQRTQKGAVLAELDGLSSSSPRAITAHIDTLGTMVAEIKSNGRLRMSAIGGIMWPTIESEGITIKTNSGATIRGSIVLENGAAHVNKDAGTVNRNAQNLEVRIDEITSSADETKLLGIDVGDFIHIDPRFEKSSSGYIRSRFLDDKACVACVLAAAKALSEQGVHAAQKTNILISNFEEVGHGGMDSIPGDIKELLVLDMAVVGHGQNGDETHCSICVKDSSGPYSQNFTKKVRSLAEQNGIDLRPDVYPYYGSDGTAYWRSGGLAQVALIGPGVDTSHAYERTHVDALKDTANLVAAYLLND